MKKIICLSALLLAGSVQAGSISNFSAVYDSGSGQLSYTFDLIAVDGISPGGVNHLYFNYNPEINPFNPTTTIVSATSANNTLSYLSNDEIAFTFDTLLNAAAISYNVVFNNIATAELAAWDDLEVFLNPGFIPGTPSASGQSSSVFGIRTHSEGEIGEAPEPASLALFGLGMAALGVARKRIAA